MDPSVETSYLGDSCGWLLCPQTKLRSTICSSRETRAFLQISPGDRFYGLFATFCLDSNPIQSETGRYCSSFGAGGRGEFPWKPIISLPQICGAVGVFLSVRDSRPVTCGLRSIQRTQAPQTYRTPRTIRDRSSAGGPFCHASMLSRMARFISGNGCSEASPTIRLSPSMPNSCSCGLKHSLKPSV